MSPPYFIQCIENILCQTTHPLFDLSVKYLWTEQLFYNWGRMLNPSYEKKKETRLLNKFP